MRIKLVDFAREDVLAGSDTGRQVQARLLGLASREPDTPQALFLDFESIEVATASFLREGILGFRDAVRLRGSKFYPVIANAGALVLDELSVLVRSLGQAAITCALTPAGMVKRVELVGELEPKQRITFDLVEARGETDAASLMREQSEQVGQTAWNNRLAALASMGLIVEMSQGRSKRYRKLF